MYWKPIPHEKPAKTDKSKTHIQKRFKKHPLKNTNQKVSYRLFQSVSIRLLEYVKKEGKYSFQEIGDLVMDMQRTITNLQRKKHTLMEKEKTKKRKRSTKPKFKVKKIKKTKSTS